MIHQQGGILAAGQQQPQGGGILARLTAAMQNNPQTMMALSAGLLDHRANANNTIGDAMRGAMAAQEVDTKRKATTGQRTATIKWLMKNRSMTEEEAQSAVDAGPEVLASYFREPGEGRDPYKTVGGALYNTQTGEWMQPPQEAGGGSLFDGTSVEGQALNRMVSDGMMTKQQALDLATGKSITNPADGSIVFKSGTELSRGGALTGPRPMTEGQGKASSYANRMKQAETTLQEVEKVGTDVGQSALSRLPMSEVATSEKYQKFDQAKRNFINATLRRESGATITPSEFENAEKQYFPVPGNSPAIIEQKRLNRLEAIRGIEHEAGPTYQSPAPVGQAPDPLGIR